MAKTSSTMLALGSSAPSFVLPNTNKFNCEGDLGKDVIDFTAYDNYRGYLIAFLCNHCPYVKHIADEFSKLANDYLKKEILTFVISSNDVENYPDDSPKKMTIEAQERGYRFPYLYDKTQEVAKSYQAACTPDFFLFDDEKKCVYRGQMDDSRPNSGIAVTGKDLTQAIDNLLAGNPPLENQFPSLGCNIKWIKENEPSYFSLS